MRHRHILALATIAAMCAPNLLAADIVHDAEYYILEAQNGERWVARATVRE